MAEQPHGERSTTGLLLAVGGVIATVAVLIGASALALEPSPSVAAVDAVQPASAVVTPGEPAPSTTMSPVQPTGEAATPAAASSGVSAAWVADVSRRTGIGSVAVDAYGATALRMAAEQPACRLGWTTLAGIGRIETGHGTSHGSHLLADGRTSMPILGPALDGTAGMAGIRSGSESAQWHGDAQWDHAMGPMQFIPSTWERWASDGNDDGVADPHNIFDAAYATGRYLCASGADLTTATGWTRAIFSYNHSDDYVRDVLASANAYAAAR